MLRDLAIISDYGTPTPERKEKFLETSKITRKLAAFRQKGLLAVSCDEVTPSPRSAQAVLKNAKPLHPWAFDLQTDGS